MRSLIACLACRNNGQRLYGKPLQYLDIKNSLSVLDYIINEIKTFSSVSEIVLGISKGIENEIYKKIAKKHKVLFIQGDEKDVLKRLITCCQKAKGSDIFRMTTESPFCLFEFVNRAWKEHCEKNNDLTAIDNVPDGAGFEIIKLKAYMKSWQEGLEKHRSEFCSLYIRENKNKFKFSAFNVPKQYYRTDIRLTIDYPEDLILCRSVYCKFKNLSPRIPVAKIIQYLDQNPKLKNLVKIHVKNGLKQMYK